MSYTYKSIIEKSIKDFNDIQDAISLKGGGCSATTNGYTKTEELSELIKQNLTSIPINTELNISGDGKFDIYSHENGYIYADYGIVNVNKGSIAGSLSNGGSTLYNENLKTSTSNKSGILIQALAPTSAGVVVENAGWIAADTYSISGTNSSEEYISELTITAGKSLDKITNSGTISKIINNNGLITVSSNTEGKILYQNKDITNNKITKIVGNVTYVNAEYNETNGETTGIQVTDSNTNKLIEIESTDYEATLTADNITIESEISFSKDDSTQIESVNILDYTSGSTSTLYEDEIEIKENNYDFFLPITVTPKGGEITASSITTFNKSGWITEGTEITPTPQTVTASGSSITKFLGIKKAQPKTEASNGIDYVDGNIILGDNKTLYIDAGFISNTYFDLSKLIPDIGEDDTYDAIAEHILNGMKAYDEEGNIIIGGMANNGSLGHTLTSQGETYTIPKGYTDGGTVTVNIANVTWNNSLVDAGSEDAGIELVSAAGYTSSKKIKSLNIAKDIPFKVDMIADDATDMTSTLTVNNAAYRVVSLKTVDNSTSKVNIEGGVLDVSFGANKGSLTIKDYGKENSIVIAEDGQLKTITHSVEIKGDSGNSVYFTDIANNYAIEFSAVETITNPGWHDNEAHGDTQTYYLKSAEVTPGSTVIVDTVNNTDISSDKYSTSEYQNSAKIIKNITNSDGKYVKVSITEDSTTISDGWINNSTIKQGQTIDIAIPALKGHKISIESASINTSETSVVGSATTFTVNVNSNNESSVTKTENTDSYNVSVTAETTSSDLKDKYVIGDVSVELDGTVTVALSPDITGSNVDNSLKSLLERMNGINYNNQ